MGDSPPGRRALVLGSGGVTGLAWQVGVLAGLSESGLHLDPDLVVGTSAGALVAARLAEGGSVDELADALAGPIQALGRLRAGVVARLLAAQLSPNRHHALEALGRRAAREWTPEASARWVRAVAGDLADRPWPARLVVVVTDTTSGRPVFFSAAHPVDLAAAVAASCAVPGVFPAVEIEGRLFFDGGLRSPANLDVAGDARRVLGIAPLTGSVRAHRRPARQAVQLARAGTRVVLIAPDMAGRRAIGVDVLAAGRTGDAFRVGRALGLRRAGDVAEVWSP